MQTPNVQGMGVATMEHAFVWQATLAMGAKQVALVSTLVVLLAPTAQKIVTVQAMGNASKGIATARVTVRYGARTVKRM